MSAHYFLYLLCYWLVTGVPASGQDAFVVAGRVIDSQTGAGVRRALVRLDGFSAGNGLRRETLTDAAGTFRFDGLPKSNWSLSASKPQFRAQFVSLEAAANPESVELRMTPLGVISGRVTDGDGRPIQGVQVRAYSTVVRGGRRRLEQQRAVATNDLGEYRLWNLPEGSYYLKAVGRAAGTSLFTTDRIPTFSLRESFVPAYLGGATRFESASPLVLGPGQEAAADFQLTLELAYKILGSVTNLEPYVTAKFELLSGTEEVSANRTFLSAVNGSFVVNDVVPGAYRLRVTQGEGAKQMIGETQVTVSAGDVGPVAMRVHGTVDVPVRVEVTDASAGLPQSVAGIPRELRSGCHPRLEALERGRDNSVEGVSGKGMAFRGVPPGEYRVRVDCYGAYVTGLTAGGADILATGKLTIAPGVPVPELVIFADGKVGGVSIEREGSALPLRTQVLIVPSGVSVEGPKMVFMAGPKVAAALAPGDYTVFALARGDFPFLEPQAVERLRNGVRVQVPVGGTVAVKLKELSE